jgi:hypothetical protein
MKTNENDPRQKDIKWYSNALEVLSPLRWHLEELLDAAESHNRFANRTGYPSMIPERKIKAAREAQRAANEFFGTDRTAGTEPMKP